MWIYEDLRRTYNIWKLSLYSAGARAVTYIRACLGSGVLAGSSVEVGLPRCAARFELLPGFSLPHHVSVRCVRGSLLNALRRTRNAHVDVPIVALDDAFADFRQFLAHLLLLFFHHSCWLACPRRNLGHAFPNWLPRVLPSKLRFHSWIGSRFGSVDGSGRVVRCGRTYRFWL